jgi:hypothetical protein
MRQPHGHAAAFLVAAAMHVWWRLGCQLAPCHVRGRGAQEVFDRGNAQRLSIDGGLKQRCADRVSVGAKYITFAGYRLFGGGKGTCQPGASARRQPADIANKAATDASCFQPATNTQMSCHHVTKTHVSHNLAFAQVSNSIPGCNGAKFHYFIPLPTSCACAGDCRPGQRRAR